MSKLKFIIPILCLAVLVLIGAGCGTGAENRDTGKTESLTEVLAKVKDMISYKYDAVVTTPNQTAITQKIWFKEKKIRMEMIVEGQNLVYLVDMNKLLAYLYMPAQNMAMKMNFGEAQKTIGKSPTEQSKSIMDYNPVTVGSEILDGKNCLIIEYTAETGETKMWLWTKYGIPIKTEITTVKGTTIVETNNIEFGNIADNMFELPTGVQPMSVPNFGF